MNRELTTQEKLVLRSYEKTIRESRDRREVGKALKTIHDQGLYKGSYKRWDVYCRKVLRMSGRHGYRLIKAEIGFDRLEPSAVTPRNEGQMRELLKAGEEQRLEVLEQAGSSSHGRLTARLLREVLDRQLLDGSAEFANKETAEAVENLIEFVREKDLEEFIISNFEKLFDGALRIYENPVDGTAGRQYPTRVGLIDILATGLKGKSFVVIELKKARSSDHVVGQVLRYMGWVRENLCKDGQSVKGLVISSEPDPKLSYAIKEAKNVGVKYYKVSFKLSDGP